MIPVRLPILPTLALLVATSGCVPNSVSYYRPTLEGGTIVEERCVPIESGVDFAVGWLPVRARVIQGKDGDRIALILSPMPGQEIRLTSNRFAVRDLATGQVLENLSIEVYRDDRLDSMTSPSPRVPGARSFWVYVVLPEPAPAEFELTSPAVLVNGIEHAFPVIRFERKVWMGISPFNC